MSNLNQIVPQSGYDSVVNTATAIKTLDDNTKAFVTTVGELSKALKKGGISLKEINKAQKQSEDITKQQIKLQKEQESAEKALSTQRNKALKEINKQSEATKKAGIATAKNIGKESQYFKELKKTTAQLKKEEIAEKKKTVATKKAGIATLKNIGRESQYFKQLRLTENQLKRNKAQSLNFSSALKNMGTQLMGALGLTAGVYLFIGALKSMFGTITKFGQAQATLAATLGKTREEIIGLTEDSIAYGKTTKFTATEVSGLQNELAKLGFTMSEIGLMTDGVLKLAEATGADLAEAAKVTGVALKAFGLSAIEAESVAATLAIATTKSALSFQDYETALSTAGAVANSFGFSLEDTIALMGKLKDAGFDSSKASTALRNILLNLADSNGALSKKLGGSVKSIDEFIPALIKLKEDGVSLNETLQITDKRSVAAFNTLLQGAGSVLELRDAITGANDALAEMVETKIDNTIDAMARMGSAWDGVVLTFRKSDGFFTTFFNGISNFMNSITDEYTTGFDKYVSLWSVGLINLGAEGIAIRKKTVDDLQKLNEQELSDWVYNNKDKLISDDKFQVDLYNRAVERLVAIEEANRTSEERNADVIAQAKKESADEQSKIESITTALFLSEQEKKNAAIDKKAIKLSDSGVSEVNVTKWVIQEKGRIQDEYTKKVQDELNKRFKAKIKKIADEKKAEQDFETWLENLDDEYFDYFEKQLDKELDVLDKQIKEKQKLESDAKIKAADDDLARAEQLKQAKIDLAIGAAEAGFAIYQGTLTKEAQALEMQRQNELLLVGDNKEAQAKINDKYDKQAAVIRTKQAKADKAAAMISVAINAALAIVSAYTTPPAPVGFALGAIMAGLAAVQIAAIAAQPIPKFFKGTESAPKGLISVSEKGGELIHKKTGELIYAPEQTYMSGIKGAKIYTNEETERIFQASGHDSGEIKELVSLNKKMVSAMENQTHYSFETERVVKSKGNFRREWKNVKLAR